MTTKTYTVTGKSGANLRALPSGKSKIVTMLPKGADCTVIADFSASNSAGGSTTKYLCVIHDGEYLWAAAQNLAKKRVNYQARLADVAREIYPLSIGKRHGVGVQRRVKNLEQFKRSKELNCHLMVSLCLQEAGLLPKGCVITHTPKASGKHCIKDAVRGTENLKHCKAIWVDKPYHKLPEELRAPGIVYIQNSNACISMGNGHIFSCNKRKNYRYTKKSDYDRETGYVKESNVLVCLVPEK